MNDHLLERLKRLHPKVIDLALDRVQGLLAALDHPEQSLPPVVHIAGTNGKGSVLALLRAMAESAGLAVHVYTSPHLVHFAERIRLAGEIIADSQLLALLEECEAKNQSRPITFFEITTAAAFLAFARLPADLCLLETGLGGRFDATNVVRKPALTLLSPIALDHQAYLGDSLGAIAFEKAGILKAGVPCVCSYQEPEALAVILERAAAVQAPLYLEGRDWQIAPRANGLAFAFGHRQLALPLPSLLGDHQFGNAGLAAAAACLLALPAEPIGEGVASARWPARLQSLRKGPLVELLPKDWQLWLDGGHNPAAGHALARFISGSWQDQPLDLLVGMLNSKDSLGFLAPLRPLIRRLVLVDIPGEPNSLPAGPLAAAAAQMGFDAMAAIDLADGVRILSRQNGPARILICGSLYLAGAVLTENG
ncbi:MAG TPA: bifunctional folylpolyglutamate synthase/dihydrofolate synthase [Rhodospirillaceae bacterium]|nr:bifunctional folylpolyglutamate synthase/dihydrofolate synthase [Rhodospirillaceae bacterium]